MTPQEAIEAISKLETTDQDLRLQIAPILEAVEPVPAAHLDPERAAAVLDWCKREGGLDLYGWGDLISRLNECVIPAPPDAHWKVDDAYRQGYEDARREATR